ncbi:MAG: BBE domain-containing protein [Rhodobacter sp.]|nr:BBE domain-containing protein [Rhodobacter sp.]
MVLSRSPALSDRQGFDRRWFAPDLDRVYLPTTGAEVAAAWAEIVANGPGGPGATQITCGRHCYENFVYRDETRTIIDVTGLRDFGEDPAYGFYIGVGYGNWDMYRIFNNVYSRTLPAGSCYSVGLGGHITGGGYGILSRQWGLTVDHMTAVDIVVKTGHKPELITASASENADLFWAVRGGGGGNFGIITRYYFGDPPQAPNHMASNAFTFDWTGADGTLAMTLDRFTDLLTAFAAFSETGQGGPQNDFDIFHGNHKAAGSIVWSSYSFDLPGEGLSAADHAAAMAERYAAKRAMLADLAPLSETPGPILGHPWHGSARHIMPQSDDATHRSYTFLEGVQNANGSGPNRFGKYKSAYMNKAFTPEMIEALWTGLQIVPDGMDMSASLCQVDSYGCAINAVAPDATPIPQRSAIMKLQYQTYWDNACGVGRQDPAQTAAHVKWIDTMYTDVYGAYGGFPDPRNDSGGVVDGCYYNYCDNALGVNGQPDPGIDHAMYLYFKENFQERPQNLQSVKARWNPENWFNGPQSIPI